MRRSVAITLALAVALAVLAILVILPFWWVMSSSVKATSEIVSTSPTMFPRSFTLEHFEKLLGGSDFPRFLFNSVIVSLASMALTVAFAVLAGYAFFRLRFPGRDLLYRAILLAYAFPGIVVLTPLYGMMSAAGLIDNPLALVIVNVTFAVPFAIWMMRAFLAAVPVEIEEAARLDGASRLIVLRRIVLPLIAPGVASVAIFAFVSSWTEYLFASVLIQTDAHKTIPVGLAGIIGQYQVDWGLMLAGATITTLPVLALFAVIGRYFVAGLTAGAIK
ncbi:carbohydrate ABC transporter membrane protein 2 (CUT1 family) [Roseiarcus fermentans]|uniref:Carbohydrate ABC transporter membrane protein 2 (CUT1 family) n=1 Tax=Roseiarcus fermentans TaxID=1473586 RepID=A0A366F917_9HYPH|nr:carbohydrate ABC transporter permease [Roseiarcus fermentans]RBP11128.1 carbohydrate ABC transporter membrane protein 2 (CUT1 family) [Roseiarcus fermentans]